MKRELNFCNGYLSQLCFCTYLSIIWYHSWCRILGIPIVVVAIQTCFAGVLSTVILSCLLILFYGQNVFHFLSSFCWQNMAQNVYEGTYQSHYKTEKKNLIKNVVRSKDIYKECSKHFKWNSYFYEFGQSRPFWAALKLL